MPYFSGSPSSNNNISSNRHWIALQLDWLYTVTEGEGRKHLQYKVGTRLISGFERIEGMFFCVLGDLMCNFYVAYYFQKGRFSL
jgi:hypothetical protein